jgi:hypothetical protein
MIPIWSCLLQSAWQKEDTMPKGQLRGNKEAKKPKADHDHPKKSNPSAYQRSLGKEHPADEVFKRKN